MLSPLVKKSAGGWVGSAPNVAPGFPGTADELESAGPARAPFDGNTGDGGAVAGGDVGPVVRADRRTAQAAVGVAAGHVRSTMWATSL